MRIELPGLDVGEDLGARLEHANGVTRSEGGFDVRLDLGAAGFIYGVEVRVDGIDHPRHAQKLLGLAQADQYFFVAGHQALGQDADDGQVDLAGGCRQGESLAESDAGGFGQ